MSKRKLNERLTVRVTSKEHKMLKKRAAAENEPSVGALLRRVLKTYLKEHRRNKKNAEEAKPEQGQA